MRGRSRAGRWMKDRSAGSRFRSRVMAMNSARRIAHHARGRAWSQISRSRSIAVSVLHAPRPDSPFSDVDVGGILSRGGAAPILERRSMASPVPTTRILFPRRAPGRGSPCGRAPRVPAEMLGIPWRRLLAQEIEAEQRLRTYLPDLPAECPLEAALEILSAEAARSWRVRDQLETLAWQARASVRGADKKMRAVLLGIGGASESRAAAVGRRCGAAYGRILLLQRARRAAARRPRDHGGKARVRLLDGLLQLEDAAWALREGQVPRRGRRMEAAVRKVREEGFLTPRAASEARSLSQLRRIVFGFRDGSSKKTSLRSVLMQIVRESNITTFRSASRTSISLAVALLRMAARPRSRWPRRRNENKDLAVRDCDRRVHCALYRRPLGGRSARGQDDRHVVIRLDTLRGNPGGGIGINDKKSWVTGVSTSRVSRRPTPLYREGETIDLGTLGGPNSAVGPSRTTTATSSGSPSSTRSIRSVRGSPARRFSERRRPATSAGDFCGATT